MCGPSHMVHPDFGWKRRRVRVGVLPLCATPACLVSHDRAQERDLWAGRRILFHLLNQRDGTDRELRFKTGRTGAYLHANWIAQRFSRDTCPFEDICPIHALSTAWSILGTSPSREMR